MENKRFGTGKDKAADDTQLRKSPTAVPVPTHVDADEDPVMATGLTALRKHVSSLTDAKIIPTLQTAATQVLDESRERIAHFVDAISKDIYGTVDVRLFAGDNHDEIRKTIAACVTTVVEKKKLSITPRETEGVIKVLESDILGLGPLDALLANDAISDIMVDGPNAVFVEMEGQIDKTDIRFRSEDHLLGICQRIVNRVGRHVSRSSPICDARLPDGSRVNIVLPPLSLKGPILTIRKFKKERLTLEKLVELGTLDRRTATLLELIVASRVNIIVTGGTGSGKTTLLNCLAKYISPRERIITCEDAAELMLQQPQVVALETRPASIEGTDGPDMVTLRDLLRNALRMRPDRIVVGEVRGPEAFDLMQAMNTGHDGSMGTFHANSPQDAMFRLESMVAMANLSIPIFALREQISSSVEVIVHTQRLSDGSRKVMNVTEITGMEGHRIGLRDIVSYEIMGEDESGRIYGEFRFSNQRPQFYDKARRKGLESDLLKMLQSPDI